MANLDDIARGAGVSRDVVADVFESVARLLCAGDSVNVVRFGCLEVHESPARIVPPPPKGPQQVRYQLPKSRVIRLRTSPILRGRLNKDRGPAKKLKKDSAIDKKGMKA